MDRDKLTREKKIEHAAQLVKLAAENVPDANDKMSDADTILEGLECDYEVLAIEYGVWVAARSNALLDQVRTETAKIKKYKPKKHSTWTAAEGRNSYVRTEIATINVAWGSFDDVSPEAWCEVNQILRPLIVENAPEKLLDWDKLIAAKTHAHSL